MKATSNLPMSMHRNSEVQTAYTAHMQRKLETSDASCDMCRLIENNRVDMTISGGSHNLSDFDQVCIIENEFPYENFDGRRVVLHHLLVPIHHYATSSELSQEVKDQLRNTQDMLLDSGTYDGAFVRSTYSPTTSVPGHLHIHLVKLGTKVIKQDFDLDTGKNDLEYEAVSDS